MSLAARHFDTFLPLSFLGLHGGNSSPADTKNSADPADFEAWLFTEAKTELGPFPDWPFLHDYARALIAGRKGALPDENGELVGRDVVVLKRRQILISWVTAAWFHWTSKTYPFDHGAVISSGKTASSKQGRRIRVIAEQDGYHNLGVDLMKYPNGSEITIFPSTESAAIGESLKKLHFDEWAFHRYAQQNLDSARPAVSNSQGQMIITSTANRFMGVVGKPFADYWDQAPQGQRRFYGRYCRPDQGKEFIEAEAKLPGMTEKTMKVFYPEVAEDAFLGISEGLVYPEFDVKRHVGVPRARWEECKWRIACIDPGGGTEDTDPNACYFIGVSKDESQVGVYPLPAHVAHSPEFYVRGAIAAHDYAEAVDKMGGVQRVIVGETGGANVVSTLRRMGVKAVQAEMHREEGKENVRWLLEQGLLMVHPSLTNMIAEFGLYRNRPGRDEWTGETYITSVGGRRHGDAMDALRYGVNTIILQLRGARPMVQEELAKRRGRA